MLKKLKIFPSSRIYKYFSLLNLFLPRTKMRVTVNYRIHLTKMVLVVISEFDFHYAFMEKLAFINFQHSFMLTHNVINS